MTDTNALASEIATTPEPVAQAPQGQPVEAPVEGAAHHTAEANEAPAQPIVETPNTDNQDEGIPEKWVGKSLEDILRANKELERKMHQQSEELSKYRKSIEEAPKPVEQPLVTQAEVPPVQNVKGMEDWLNEEFDKDWDNDPKTATQKDRQRRDQWRSYQDNYNKQVEFGTLAQQGKVPGYEDFAEHLPTMQSLAKQLSPLINPVYETHPELLRAVYLMAKGLSATDKLKKAATAKAQVSRAVEQEKLAATAESPSANEGVQTVDPWSMKTDDLAKLLGHVDRSVEG